MTSATRPPPLGGEHEVLRHVQAAQLCNLRSVFFLRFGCSWGEQKLPLLDTPKPPTRPQCAKTKAQRCPKQGGAYQPLELLKTGPDDEGCSEALQSLSQSKGLAGEDRVHGEFHEVANGLLGVLLIRTYPWGGQTQGLSFLERNLPTSRAEYG